MTETWCALLNVLILSIVAGANGVLLSRTGGWPGRSNGSGSRSAETHHLRED